jgi:hypothetical protein
MAADEIVMTEGSALNRPRSQVAIIHVGGPGLLHLRIDPLQTVKVLQAPVNRPRDSQAGT